VSVASLFADIKMSPVGNWSKHAATGLLLILTLGFTTNSTANITSISATQDATDATDPFLFSVDYTINTPGNSNAFVHGIILEYDDGNGYQQLGSCATSGFPNGNVKNGQLGTLTMSNISSAGLSPGTYDLRLTAYTSNKNSDPAECSGSYDTWAGTVSSFTISGGSNSPPVLTGDLAANINEEGTYDLTTTDLFYIDSDDDNAGVTFTVSNLDSALTLTVNGISQSTFTGTQLNAGQVQFTHSGVEDDSATFDVNVEDGNEDSSTPTDSTFTFTIVDQNDPPVVSDASATLAYTEGDSATVIDATLTITDVDDTNMEGATITISSGYQSSEDVLAFTNANGITGSWDSSGGVLTLSGSASKAFYEAAFESITYQNTNTNDPNNTDRTVTWVVSDGTSNSSGVTSTITVADVNDAPVVSDAGGTLSYAAGDSVAVIDATLSITDVDDTNMEGATITISSGYQSSEDVLAFTNANGITGSWDSSGGVLTLSGSASTANYETALESVTYQNTETSSPNTSDRTITWVVNDGDTNSAGTTSTISVTLPSLHHYAISFDGGSTTNNANGPNCIAIPVTVTAHDTGHSAVSTSNTVTLTTSSGNGAWVSNLNNPSIAVAFGGSSSITTYLRHPTAGATNINATDGSNTESEDPTFTFDAAVMSLEFFLDANSNGLPDGAGDDIPSITAGTNLNQVLLGIVDGGSVCTQDTTAQDQTLSTNLAYECINPTTCRRDKDLSVTPSGGSATGIEENNAGAAISYEAVDLVFNANGFAPIPLNYQDAGSVKLHGTLTVPASGNDPALLLTGSSNAFVSKPADLVITVSGNPATTSSGSGFITAGTDFNVSVQAQNSQGGTTPNFGQETSAETAKVSLVALTYPTGGINAGTLTSGTYSLSGSTDGAGTVVANFNEVGTISMRAEIGDEDYLGAGNVTGTTSGNIGRFFPRDFLLSGDGVIDGCTPATDFTYMDASDLTIGYTITAKNASGATVTHYDTSDGYAVASVTAIAESTSNDGNDLSARLTHSSTTWDAGVYTVTDTSAKFSKGSSPEPEVDLDIALTLTDSLDNRNFDTLDFNPGTSGDCTSDSSCTSRDLSGNPKLRWGRLNISSASGPERQNLPVPFETEYYNGATFVTNTDDGCTTIARSRIEFNDGAISTTDNLTIDIGGGSDNSTGSSINANLTSADLVMVSGDGNLVFSAPSDGDRGSFTVDVDLTDLPYLYYDWDLDGSHDDSPPTATGTFGVFEGHDKILFRKVSN